MGGEGFTVREPRLHRRPGWLLRPRHIDADRGWDVRRCAGVRRRGAHGRGAVLDGEDAVYGLCRPPGHHAGRSTYGGYCYFNNAAVAAHALAERTGERVAILDVDYHHGNGTQHIFWRRGDVLYVSLHGDPARQYPYYLGYADERGEGDGRGREPEPAATGRARPRGVPGRA